MSTVNRKHKKSASKTQRSAALSSKLATILAAHKGKQEFTFFPSGKGSGGPRQRRVVITEDEYIGEVNGSTSTSVPTVTTYPFNPGQSATFPRMSVEAALYQRWVLKSAAPYYKPEVSAYATNGQSGKIMLSFQYNPALVAPVTKTQIMDTRPHAECMPYQSCVLRLDPREVNGQKNGRMVRTGALPSNSSIIDYDGGNLFVSTIGNAATTLLGEIHIKYTFVLEDAVLLPPGTDSAAEQLHIYTNATSTDAAPMTTAIASLGNTIPATFTSSVLTLLSQVIGTAYEVLLTDYAANIAAAPTLTITSGASSENEIYNLSTGHESSFTSNTSGMALYTIVGTAASIILALTGGTTTTGGSMDIFVNAISKLLYKSRRVSQAQRAIIKGLILPTHVFNYPIDYDFVEWHSQFLVQQAVELRENFMLNRIAILESKLSHLALNVSEDEEHIVPEAERLVVVRRPIVPNPILNENGVMGRRAFPVLHQ